MGASMSGGAGRGGRRRGGRRGGAPMAEINVTPFVDVMLVLLIIFMVAAPLLTAGIPLNLPNAPAKALPLDKKKKPLIIDIDNEGRIYIDKSEVPLDGLIPSLTSTIEGRIEAGDSEAEDVTKEFLVIRADGENTVQRFSQVLALLNTNGFTKFGIVTDPNARVKPGVEAPNPAGAE